MELPEEIAIKIRNVCLLRDITREGLPNNKNVSVPNRVISPYTHLHAIATDCGSLPRLITGRHSGNS